MNIKFASIAAFVFILTNLLSACAAPPPEADKQATASTQNCQQETSLGSQIAHRHCTATAMTQEERDAIARDVTLRGVRPPVVKQ